VKIYDDIGVAIPDVYLPKPGTDLRKWAVIACDQFTSEPEYWQRVANEVGNAPSTLNLVFPEIYLEAPGKEERIRDIQATMRKYLGDRLLKPREGLIYVERQVGGRKRTGLLLCLDLECYDYQSGAKSLIRSTEGTIVERLPPRMSIRENAALEVPHILVLIDDPERTVIEPIEAEPRTRQVLYDFDLMLHSGHLTGFAVSQQSQDRAIAALRRLAEEETFRARYGVAPDRAVLLFAMGDGNHSLATAKAVWEKIKPRVRMDHPARYALVEIENIHDAGLEFEPIHRVLFGLKHDLVSALQSHFGATFNYQVLGDAQDMLRRVDASNGGTHVIGLVRGEGPDRYGLIEIARPASNLPVGTVQAFLDLFVQQGGADRLDYVHGGEVVVRLASQPCNAGFYLPRMGKSSLFKTVILDGALPRKTFSMGEAREKRFYMESRKIE
jgi:hypothetical protein